jgi:hypothetical protein
MLSYSTTRKKRMFGGGLRTVSQWPIKKKLLFDRLYRQHKIFEIHLLLKSIPLKIL